MEDWRKYRLIICEKPAAAEKIASALGDGHYESYVLNGVPIYRTIRGKTRIVVVPALGHLYALAQDGGPWLFPVLNLRWTPMYMTIGDHELSHKLKNWLKTISKLSKRASSFVSACDYDIEGSVVAYTILRYACRNSLKRARRMKFSALTKKEIINAYENMMKELDYPLINAGLIRHMVDWLFGVNVSRALMTFLKEETGKFEILSAGRVQSPTLYALVKREVEINTHVPIPYWVIEAEVKAERLFKASYHKPKISSLREVNEIKSRCEGKEGFIESIEKKTSRRRRPPPFNLSSLQAEAYKLFGYTPSKTQAIAEKLYLEALISYPRTSSQKLPPSIGYEEIINSLKLNPAYEKLASEILKRGIIRPAQGKRDDPAHPAIYPTGNLPSRPLEKDEERIYDLIVRRFLACFSDDLVKEHRRLIINVNDQDKFVVVGSTIVNEGWLRFYPYSSVMVGELPSVKEGGVVHIEKLIIHEKLTQAKPRFNPSSLLKFMERNNLGTKSTRAEIIDTLYQRGYIQGDRIAVTELGFTVVNILKKFFPEMLSIELTRRLEEQMNGVEAGVLSPKEVMLSVLDDLRQIFEKAIIASEGLGFQLLKSIEDAKHVRRVIGKCPLCGVGDLIIMFSKKSGKRFIGCSRHSQGCQLGLPLPQKGFIEATGATCKICGYPIIKVKGLSSKPWYLCVNPNCPSKKR
ncbi:MAG: DNA topoisomerase I [Candidatus Methanomethylicota archaeon]|uniref:DNA topoisomerase 1 n=1 Tax=Thermoproteota archaeon TaxID=2056631 RepID=A0A497F131_9CREN|nr:MAG: DNA topoisomerase I [Candidatus Verstraetearchaeota archaeon]RLE53019.1 MAG: DNA topoisomerase I [Candidatus Verstraetearchaeota archaeon]